jgi:hypothetical protein
MTVTRFRMPNLLLVLLSDMATGIPGNLLLVLVAIVAVLATQPGGESDALILDFQSSRKC